MSNPPYFSLIKNKLRLDIDEILDKVEEKLMVKTSQETSCTTPQRQENIFDR